MSGIDFTRNQIVVAMDHARYFGTVPGLENPGAVVDSMIDAGADAIMTSYGVIKRYRDKMRGRVPMILRLDGGASVFREEWLRATEWRLLHSVRDAIALGVDGVCLMLFMGSEVELDTMTIVADVASECLDHDLPLMVEALPCPAAAIPDTQDAGAMAAACRLAFEHGADVLKTYYTGSPESFQRVTAGCPAPVLIAGGPKMDTETDVLEVVHGAVAAGGTGVVFGRNIWQSPNPRAMMSALRRIIHEGGSVAEAAELLR